MNLAEIRSNKSLTLQQVADKIGCSKQACWNYEKGIRKIPLSIAIKLSKIYEVTVEDIFFCSSSNHNVNRAISI